MLSLEERNDLRKRVLSGKQLTLEESKEVLETLRQGSGAMIIAGNEAKPKKGKASKGISDDQLDAELGDLGL